MEESDTSEVESPPVQGFRVLLPALLAGTAALILFYLSSAPTITWIHDSQDSGELAACAFTGGIPHPTGYPLYMMLGWLATHVMSWLEPGRAMVMLSVLSGALAAGIIARTSSLAIRLVWRKNEVSPAMAGWCGAAAGAYAAINPLIWSQSVVCEVYSLAILLQALVWYFLVMHLECCEREDTAGSQGKLYCLWFSIGLVIAHHLAGAGILLPVIIILLMCRNGQPIKNLLKAVLAVIPGLLMYLYIPVRSVANPVLDWGNPENIRNFLQHVSGHQYQDLIFGVTWVEFIRRVDTFRAGDYWGILAMILFFTGLFAFLIRPKRCPARALPIGIAVYMVWVFMFASAYLVTDFEIFYYPLAVMVAVAIGPGIVLPAMWLARVHRLLPWILYLVLILTLVTTMNHRWVDIDSSNPELNSAGTFTYRALSELPDDSLIIAGTDGHLFSLMYGITCGITHPVTGERIPPREDMDLVGSRWVLRDWFRENVHVRYGADGSLQFNSDNYELLPALRDLIDQNLDHRPVYVDGSVLAMLRAGPGTYEVSPTLALFRIVPEQDQ